jgi:hypothetical protein
MKNKKVGKILESNERIIVIFSVLLEISFSSLQHNYEIVVVSLSFRLICTEFHLSYLLEFAILFTVR